MALHGDDAYERKLRPVYDALDARSYKQAIKLADAALKKYKNDQLVRALKGYALHRSGKHEEALQLMRDIVAEGPEAERVVMTMTYTYKAAGQPEGITQAYIAAAEKLPRDPEVLTGLFKSYVREFNFVKQQQVAMKLSKLVPAGATAAGASSAGDNKYQWWIVCSLALQARAALLRQDQQGNPLPAAPAAAGAGGGLAPEKLLQLAETMAARQAAAATQQQQAAAGKGQAAAGVQLSYEALLLYLDILQGQGKAAQALQAIEGPMGEAVPLPADRLQLRAAALVRAGDLPAAAACYRQAVQAAPDDWLSWQLYLDCMLPGSADGSSSGSSAGGSRFPVGVVGGLADIWDRQQQQQAAAASAAAGSGQDAAAVEAALAEVDACVRQLSDEVAASDSWRQQCERATLRAPHLWRCEALLRRHRLALAAAAAAAGDVQQQAGMEELAAAVGKAFGRLAGNFSCVSDLRPYLAVLSGPAADQLAEQVHRQAAELNAADAAAAAADTTSSTAGGGAQENGSSNGSSSGASGEVRRLQRLVNAFQLEAELGLPCFPAGASEAAAQRAQQLLDLYRQHMHLSAGLDEKERGYGEELVAAAAAALVRAAALEAAADRRVARLLQALLVLEAAQQRRKVSAPLRLAATALYGLLGAPKLAAAQCAALDIKSIQHDSMTGHWLLPLLAGAGAAAGADDADQRRWVDGCAALHDQHQAEAGDTLGTALQHGTYSKVAEFVDFKERLQHSHTRALAAVAQALRPGKDSSSGGSAAAAAPAHHAALQHARQLLAANLQQPAVAVEADAAQAAGSSSASASGGSAEPLLRFNEDLSTRPSWFPPSSAGSSAVPDWWQWLQQGQPAAAAAAAGYAQCWWARPQAAESGRPEAVQWRQRCLEELRASVGWALVVCSPLATSADAATLLEQLQPLLLPAGVAPPAEQQAAGSALRATACKAAVALLQAVVGGGAEAAAAAADLQPVQALAQACSRAAQLAAAELSSIDALPVLSGGAVASAAAMQADCRTVNTVCGRLQKLAAAAGLEAAATAAGQACGAASEAAAAAKQAAAAVLQGQGQQQRVQQALELLASCQLSGGSGSGGRDDACLWSFDPDFKAEAVLEKLVSAQLAALQCLQQDK